jgi:hypothetical protein
MLKKLGFLECAQRFIHLMYDFLEIFGKVMAFMLPPGSVVGGNGQQLFPVRALSPFMRMNAYRRRWISKDLTCTGCAPHLKPTRHLSRWSPFSE